MRNPHKHAEVIKAWADGAVIQMRLYRYDDWVIAETPNWDESIEYRVKPEIKGEKYYLKRLVELQSWVDTEDAHVMADSYLCAFLEELGYQYLVNEYNAINKWYA